jgi:hypothetical protein
MARSLRLLLATLALLLLALSAAAVAAAEAPLGEEAAAGAATEEAEPAPMSVDFPRRRATLIGARALVFVRCSGLAAQTCEGTLVLKGPGGSHKVPYAIDRGEQRPLVVPLGQETSVAPGAKARVVARTLQLSGSTVRTSTLLRVG